MFPAANGSSVTVVGAVLMAMMMMMMMMATEAAPNKKRSDETVSLHLDPNVLLASRNLRPLQNTSISPWTYDTSNDDSLFPPMISEARCLLQGCLDLEGKEDLNLRSRPIRSQVMVLRRVKGAGQEHGYHYRLESRLISVGCTCVRHMVHVQH